MSTWSLRKINNVTVAIAQATTTRRTSRSAQRTPCQAQERSANEVLRVRCLTMLAFSPKKLSTTSALGSKVVTQKPSSETFNEVLRHGPAADAQIGRTNDRRTSAKSIENWQVPEIAVAPFSGEFPRSCSGRTSRGTCSRCSSRGANPTQTRKSYVTRNYVDVEDMSHHASQRKRWRPKPRTDTGQEENHAVKTMHDSYLDQKNPRRSGGREGKRGG